MRYSTLLVIFILSTYGYAQTEPKWEVYQTPNGTVSIKSESYTAGIFKELLAEGTPAYVELDFVIKTKTNPPMKGSFYFHFGEGKHYLTPLRDTQSKIFPSDTESLYYEFSGNLISSIPSDTCWLFRVVEGPINVYSPYPSEAKELRTSIQKGNGDIVALNKTNLAMLVSDQPKVLRHVQKGRLHHAIWKYNEEH